jgi:hypothetical protein
MVFSVMHSDWLLAEVREATLKRKNEKIVFLKTQGENT